MTIRHLILCLFILATQLVLAQEILTLENAIAIGIQNNFNVQIADNNLSISENNATRGNAGQLPKVGFNSSATYTNQNTDLEFLGEQPSVSISGAQSTRTTASVDLSYTIFAGRGNHYKFERLQSDVEQSDYARKRTIENLVVQITNAYVNLVSLYKARSVAEQTISVSASRNSRINNLIQYGQATTIDKLNSEIDLQTDSSTFRNTELSIRMAKRNLNTLLGRAIETEFDIEQSINLGPIASKEEIIAAMWTDNVSWQTTSSQLTATIIEMDQARARFYPSLSTNISYGLSNNRNEAGILQVQNQVGLSAGLTLQFNLFDGFTQKRSYENSKLKAESQNFTKQQLELQLLAEVNNAYDNYEQAIFELEREKRNNNLADENLRKTQRLLELGQVNSLQFRESQLNKTRVEERIIQKENQLVIAKLELLRLSGGLLTSSR